MAKKRFKSTIMCNGLGEFQYIKIKDKSYSDNHLTYHISSDNDLDYLLNSLNEDIVDLKNKKKKFYSGKYRCGEDISGDV